MRWLLIPLAFAANAFLALRYLNNLHCRIERRCNAALTPRLTDHEVGSVWQTVELFTDLEVVGACTLLPFGGIMVTEFLWQLTKVTNPALTRPDADPGFTADNTGLSGDPII